jgi:dTDP-4-amino-4,6-dideoxygalactose transaminase
MTATAAPSATEVAVPLLDLKAQYATIRAEIEPILREVCESQYFIGGPKVEALEREVAAYCSTQFAVGCANGSDAILIALQALDIGAGDAVICPSYTFFATAGSIHRLGAKPVFVDCDPATYNICPESTRAAFRCHGAKVKAIVPVHLFGQAADLDTILGIAKEHGVPVIEDAAQAIGTEDAHGTRVGSRGVIGTFSFFPSKNLGGFGDGGIVTTNDAKLADRMKRLRNHGMEPKYYHDEVGLNSRLDALQAAILSVKLRHLDAWSAGRQKNAAYYDRRFAEAGATTSATPISAGGFALRTPHPAPKGSRHIYNQYVIRVPAAMRDRVRDTLGKRKVGTEIYYPVPLHLQKCFASLGYREGTFPHSELAAKESIALPIYADLSPAQLDWVATSVIDAVRAG